MYRNVTAEWSNFGCNPPNVNKSKVASILGVIYAVFAAFYVVAWIFGPKSSPHDDDLDDGHGGGGGGGGGGSSYQPLLAAERDSSGNSMANVRRR